MKYNSKFVGLSQLKLKHKSQLDEFELWAAQDEWMNFHHSHYDWWMFPINKGSSYGLKWTVYEGEIFELKQDEAFIKDYIRGVELVSASWGWDVHKAMKIAAPKPAQSWHQWPIRLHKAALSTRLFGFDNLFNSLREYALSLIKQKESMIYRGRDLGRFFLSKQLLNYPLVNSFAKARTD